MPAAGRGVRFLGSTRRRPNRRWPPRLARVSYRSKSRRGWCKSWWQHQWLTEDVGHPALAQHLHAVITLMRVSKNWGQFKLMIDIAHPKRNDTLQLPLMADFE